MGCSTKITPVIKKSESKVNYVVNKVDVDVSGRIHSLNLKENEVYYFNSFKEKKDIINLNKINLSTKNNTLIQSYSETQLFDTKVYNGDFYSVFFNEKDSNVLIMKNKEVRDQYDIMDFRYTPKLHIYNNELCCLRYHKNEAFLKN